MSTNIKYLFFAFLMAALLCGCTSQASLTVKREHPTLLSDNEVISIVLEKYSVCEKNRCNDLDIKDFQTKEQEYLDILTKLMTREKPNIILIPSAQFRSLVCHDKDYPDCNMSLTEVLHLINDVNISNAITKLHIKYLIFLEVKKTTGEKVGRGDVDPQLWVFDYGSDINITIIAKVLDVSQKYISGYLSLYNTGRSGIFLPMACLCVPLLPIPYSSSVEKPTLKALPLHLIEFLEGTN